MECRQNAQWYKIKVLRFTCGNFNLHLHLLLLEGVMGHCRSLHSSQQRPNKQLGPKFHRIWHLHNIPHSTLCEKCLTWKRKNYLHTWNKDILYYSGKYLYDTMEGRVDTCRLLPTKRSFRRFTRHFYTLFITGDIGMYKTCDMASLWLYSWHRGKYVRSFKQI